MARGNNQKKRVDDKPGSQVEDTRELYLWTSQGSNSSGRSPIDCEFEVADQRH